MKTVISNHNTEPMLDLTAVSLLFGVAVADFEALPRQENSVRIPSEWTRRGRQRAREAMAHTGSDSIIDSLRYWARKDHGEVLDVVFA